MKKAVFWAILSAVILAGVFQCPLYGYIGIPCPSCGMTRAWRLAFAGDMWGAFWMHPLFWMPPLLILPPFRKKWVLWIMLGLLIAVYVIRMITLFPDQVPMNYNYDSILGGFIR